ncbi:Rieske (2Fe-2S) protein [Nonomuraea pusilla]|uniref:Cytochrome bc1 complex Rieske iron-sulfur subunit n=1 Tax=Nonomuraea pusilla TaxID=46177 RepID=A0A1H7UTJ7_9ACTN|nr:Rieske (2Fe-2S) protein [Nonomuraea pusilla]SEM00302.1 Ferredoxin subunit of nitrite reductase or a ring-hydroxylating dioxygenase [Nonomuraea pusilla]
MTEKTRRAVVLGAGGAGLAAVLTACASYGTTATQAEQAPAQGQEPAGEQTSGAPHKKKQQKKARALADVNEIPTGGGKVFEREKIVVTQPVEGEFKAFTAVCTHAGCTVASVSNGTINCPCHGSKFKIEDGSVARGPAGAPLEEKKISVDGDTIRLA